jgi:hypothetical protein
MDDQDSSTATEVLFEKVAAEPAIDATLKPADVGNRTFVEVEAHRNDHQK